MTVTVVEPAPITVMATSENTYVVTLGVPATIPISVALPNKGDPGANGDQGLQGIQGTQGIQGIQGIQGEIGISWEAATFETTVDFLRGSMIANATIVDPTMTTTKIIQAFFTDHLDEVAVLNMRVTERSRTAGVGFDIIAVAPNGAFGAYTVRCIVSGS